MISLKICSFAASILLLASVSAVSQPVPESPEDDGIPVLIKHLPDWEKVRERAALGTSSAELKTVLGDRAVLDQIDFNIGTEAVMAPYDAGKLLIIEYDTPQASIEADGVFKRAVASDKTTVYRRIGNYNAFVFDVTDVAAASALLDQISYEKEVQWLGKNPFIIDPERAFVLQITDVFISTVLWIIIGICIALISGGIAGWMYFRRSEQRRATLATFTDAGGMTRLNLDGFTPEIAPDRLLNH